MQHKASKTTSISNHQAINYKPILEIQTPHEKGQTRGYAMKILNMICVPGQRPYWCYWQSMQDPVLQKHELRHPLTLALTSIQHLSLTPALHSHSRFLLLSLVHPLQPISSSHSAMDVCTAQCAPCLHFIRVLFGDDGC